MRIQGVAAFALIGLLAACGDDDPGPASRQRCEVTQTRCDIEEPSCLQSLLDLAACVREDDSPPLPEVHLITSDELAEQLRSEAEEMGLGPTPWDALLPKLRLSPEDQSTIDASIVLHSKSVAAFYRDTSKDITIITDSDAGADILEEMYLMLHELTHYLQDRESDLEALQDRAGDTSDERVSLNALIEGEAVVNSTEALILVMNRAPQAFNWERFFDSLDESLFEEVSDSSSPLLAAMQVLPYSVGGRYVARVALDGRSAVDELFDDWPRAFCDWMTTDVWNQADTLQQPLDCAPPLAPEGFSLYEVERFGSAGAFALLAAAGDIDAKLAASLRNDAFAVYVDSAEPSTPSEARSIGVWRLRFESSSATTQFVKAIVPLDLETQQFDEELTIRVTSDEAITQLGGKALEACPKLEDLKPMKPESGVPSAALRKIFH
jgi:hypothetical protein